MVTERRYRCGPVTMFPRGSFWYFEFQIAKQRWTRTTKEPLRNSAKAERVALDKYEKALMRSRGEEPEPTLGEAFVQWVNHPDHVLSKSASHLANMERCGRLHLGHLAALKLTGLTNKELQDERGVFLKTHAISMANQWLTYIRIICKWAIGRGMIRAMPFTLKELKPKKRPKLLIPTAKAEDWLAEVDALTEHEPSIGMVLRLMIGLGLRGGEARAARWEWVDLEREVYTVGETKSQEPRVVPIPPWILEDLKAAAQPCGWMAPTMAGALVTPGRVKRVFEAACRAVDVPRLVPHRLRATFATWMSENGASIQDIQAALGHADIRTTAVYLGVDLGRIAQAQKGAASKARLTSRKSAAEGA
jgi:integrase